MRKLDNLEGEVAEAISAYTEEYGVAEAMGLCLALSEALIESVCERHGVHTDQGITVNCPSGRMVTFHPMTEDGVDTTH